MLRPNSEFGGVDEVDDIANEPAQETEVLVGIKGHVMATEMEKVKESKCRGGSVGC